MKQTKVEYVVKAVDVDKELANHLKGAEEHLIEAVKLFEKKRHPQRTLDYIARLCRMQEGVTTLYREELVRIRGPIKIAVSAGKKRKK